MPVSDRFDDVPNLAIFCDFENVALGVRDAHYDDFDIQLVLERLLDKGKIVVKKAYADWDRYKAAKRGMHEAAFEMIEIPHVSYSGKNSADIRLVVDALDLCHTKQHVDVFVIVSGDSDFSPLVSKLRENAKRVIGLGVKSSSSHLLIDNCDEFIYYDDLHRAKKDAARKDGRRTSPGSAPTPQRRDVSGSPVRLDASGSPVRLDASGSPVRLDASGSPVRLDASGSPGRVDAPRARPVGSSTTIGNPVAPAPAPTPAAALGATGVLTAPMPTVAPGAPDEEKSEEQRRIDALDMVLDTVEALFEDRTGALYGSMVKQVLKRKRPEFSERFHGYRTFNDLLEDAGKRGLLEVEMDEKSGGFVITAFGPKA